MYRYRAPRSYRVMSFDLGHVMQTSDLVAKSFGWQTFRSYAPQESLLESRIGIDGLGEALASLLMVS